MNEDVFFIAAADMSEVRRATPEMIADLGKHAIFAAAERMGFYQEHKDYEDDQCVGLVAEVVIGKPTQRVWAASVRAREEETVGDLQDRARDYIEAQIARDILSHYIRVEFAPIGHKQFALFLVQF